MSNENSQGHLFFELKVKFLIRINSCFEIRLFFTNVISFPLFFLVTMLALKYIYNEQFYI